MDGGLAGARALRRLLATVGRMASLRSLRLDVSRCDLTDAGGWIRLGHRPPWHTLVLHLNGDRGVRLWLANGPRRQPASGCGRIDRPVSGVRVAAKRLVSRTKRSPAHR